MRRSCRQCWWLLSVGLLLGVTLLTGCGGDRPAEPEPVVARVDGFPITAVQLQEELLRQNLTAGSLTEDSLSKVRALDTLITNLAVDLAAEALDLSRDHNLNRSMRQSVLQGVVQQYADQVIQPTLTVTVPDVEQFWREHPEQFTVRRTIVQPQQIMVLKSLKDPGYGTMPAEYDGWDAEGIINDLYRRLLAGEDFDTLAMYYSQDHFSRGDCGRLGWMYYDSAKVSSYQDSLFAFPVGEIGPPFFSMNAYFIVRINGRREAGEVIPLDDKLRREVADYIGKQRVSDWSVRFRDSLEAAGTLEIIDSTLNIPIPELPSDLPIAISNAVDTIFSDEFVTSSRLFSTADGSRTFQVEDKKRLLEDMHRWRVIWKAMKDVGYLDRPEFVLTQRNFLLDAARLRILAEASDRTYRPTNEDIMTYYQQHQSEFEVDQPLHVYHIVVDNPDTAWAVKQRLDEGADFVAVFRQYYRGETGMDSVVYDLGFISEAEMPPGFYTAAAQLSVGEISDPVETKWGYHIIKMVGKKQGMPMRQAKEEIRGRLIREHQQDVFHQWRNELVGRNVVEIDYDLLARIPVLPAAADTTLPADTAAVSAP